jgi:hypothetical protein
MTEAILTLAAARNARHWAVAAATLALWLCTASGTLAGTYVIDDFESGAPVYMTASDLPFQYGTIQTGLPVFSGTREMYASLGYPPASWRCMELALASTPGDDGMRFTGMGGSGVVWYRSQTDGYHGMDFDALAVADRFYVKLSEDPGAEVRLSCTLQDQDAAYGIGAVSLDGSGYLEIPFAAWDQDEPFHPDFHHVSAFSFQVDFFGTTTKSVTVTEFGITDVPEPASAVLLAGGALAMLLWRRTHVRHWLRM